MALNIVLLGAIISVGFYIQVSCRVGNHSLLCGLSSIFHCVVKGIENALYSAPSCPVNRTGGPLTATNSRLKMRFVASFHPHRQAVFD